MGHVGVLGELLHHRAFEGAGGGKVELGIHAQGVKVWCQGGQLPQVAVAQAAIGVQTHFNDARVQTCV